MITPNDFHTTYDKTLHTHTRGSIRADIEAFLKNGGKITKAPKPRKSKKVIYRANCALWDFL